MSNSYELEFESVPRTRRSGLKLFLLIILSVLLILFGFRFTLDWLNTAPQSFPAETTFVVEPGANVRMVATALKEKNLVRSEWYFYFSVILHHDPKNIKASTYYFEESITTNQIIERLLAGDFSRNLLSITFPEGIRVIEMVRILEQSNLSEFDGKEFLELANKTEGKLFPDTYFVPPNFTAKEWYQLLNNTHSEVMVDLRDKYQTNLTDEEVVILASIIEREANRVESMRMVSGILQNRLAINMALQADATMEYVLDKPLQELLASDLQIDSPYNTYLYAGLPPTAIGNPGRTALEAVFNPIQSNYLFYITGNDGVFYYAEDFDEHRRNIARYLR